MTGVKSQFDLHEIYLTGHFPQYPEQNKVERKQTLSTLVGYNQ